MAKWKTYNAMRRQMYIDIRLELTTEKARTAFLSKEVLRLQRELIVLEGEK